MEAISELVKEKKVTGNSQHGFIKDKSNLNNLTMFCGEQTRYTVRGRWWILFILTLAKLSICSPITSLYPSWEVAVYRGRQLAG